LIRVGGKSILQHCLEAVKACGITEAVIVTHYLGDAIRQHFGDGEKLGLKLEYVEQAAVLGTGNAVSVAEPFVDGDFVVAYGDLLFASDALKSVIGLFAAENPAAAVVELADANRVKHIVEKPAPREVPSSLVNAGLYVFPKEIFEEIKHVKASVRGELELTDALSLLIKGGKSVLAAEISKADWIDIGRPWDLLEANSWALKQMEHAVYGNVEEGAHLVGPVTVAETARVRSGAYVEGPTFIDEGSDIGPNCFIRACTSIGKNVRIGNACEVKNSLIMDGTHVGHLSYVGDSILCERCNLGAGTIMANYRLDAGAVKMVVKDKVVNSGRRKLGAILGDDVKTGVNSVLMPGVKVGVNSWVGANFMVERDLPANSVALLRQNWDKRERKS
jgi:bifunctional UDP-N-acetylglucosamine pyrophosphorylase/glucosamine-1-phosphate N-acetyltransferase